MNDIPNPWASSATLDSPPRCPECGERLSMVEIRSDMCDPPLKASTRYWLCDECDFESDWFDEPRPKLTPDEEAMRRGAAPL